MKLIALVIVIALLAFLFGYIIGKIINLIHKDTSTQDTKDSYEKYLKEIEDNYYNSPYKCRYKNYYD